MKLIYNREEALQKWEAIDKNTEKANEEAKKKNKKLGKTLKWIFVPILIAVVTVTISGLFFDFAKNKTAWVALGLFSELIFSLIASGIYDHYETLSTPHIYPTDVQYFRATEGEKILRIYAEKADSDKYLLKAEIEKENHIVKIINITSLTPIIRTDIKEEIVDLKEGKYYIPYNSQKEGKEK